MLSEKRVTMASRFIWFLGSLLALLFCLIAETETANDIGKMHADTLEKMQIAGRKMLSVSIQYNNWSFVASRL